MANKLYEESHVQNIANAIRSKSGESNTYTIGEMAGAIENIQSGTDLNAYYNTDPVGFGFRYNIIQIIKRVPYVNTYNAISFENLFSGMAQLEEVPELDFTKVNSGYYMFYNCRSLTNIPDINAPVLWNCRGMFSECRNISTINLNLVGTETSYMFANCYNLQSVNIANHSLNNSQNMFWNCFNLKEVNFGNVANLKQASYMFVRCNNLQTVNMYDFSNLVNAASMFSNTGSLDAVSVFNLNNTTFPNLTTVNNMFYESNIKSVIGLNLPVAYQGAYMFTACRNLTDASIITSNTLTNMFSIFSSCNNLINVAQFNVENVNNLSSAFGFCNNLSDDSIQNIINMVLNCNVPAGRTRVMLTNSAYSPFYHTNITNDRYTNRIAELQAAGWTV